MINYMYLHKLLIIVLFNFVNLSKEQFFPKSPCPEIFSYAYVGGQLIGNLTIPLNGSTHSIDVKVKLSYGDILKTNYGGTIELAKSVNQSVNDIIYSHVINYHIKFPEQHSLPLLTQVTVGSTIICTGPPVISAFITTISLKHSVFINDKFFDHIIKSNDTLVPEPYKIIVQSSQNTQYTLPLEGNKTQHESKTSTNLPSNGKGTEEHVTLQLEIDQKVCGRSEFPESSLAPEGNQIIRGKFPWLVAIYVIQKSGQRNFFCNGVLVSAKIVLTTAKCVLINRKIRNPKTLSIYLGGHNIKTGQEEKSIIGNVTSTFVHENYKPPSADANLAFIELESRVEYNEYIRPICLWSGSNNIGDVIGKIGTVIGWGKEAEKPSQITVPIVSGLSCLRSNFLFASLTSSRTFCAGDRNGFGPCGSDSGSGFYMYRNKRWELRGLASTILFDPVTKCDLKNYVVYTDVTKYPIIDYITYILNKI